MQLIEPSQFYDYWAKSYITERLLPLLDSENMPLGLQTKIELKIVKEKETFKECSFKTVFG